MRYCWAALHMPTVTATNTRSADHRSEPNVPTLIVAWHPDPGRMGMRRGLRKARQVALDRKSDVLGPGTLDDDRISTVHAELTVNRGKATLRDHGSRNGTFVNGSRVADEVVLTEGAVIKVGRVLLVYRTCPPTWGLHLGGDLRAIGPAMAALLVRAKLYAARDAPVLVTGATGTGKEAVARLLHDASGRRGPFLAINCAAVDENLLRSELFGHARGAFSGAERNRIGLIEQANHGTLLLDEIGDASPALQASLLRVIQEGEVRSVGTNHGVRVTTRFVAATHRDLGKLAEEEHFREDLFARLSQLVLAVPPLAERIEDVPCIASALAQRSAARPIRLHHDLAHHLTLRSWPRNAREVQGFIESELALDPAAEILLLSQAVADEGSTDLARKPRINRTPRPDRAGLLAALHGSDLNLKRCATELGVGRSTLYRWIRELDIDVASLRAARDDP